MSRRIFAKLEAGFLQDHRMMMLPSECKVAYLGFWTRAVYEGKETLTPQECDPNVIARWADVRPSAVRTLLELCKNMDRPLLELDSNGAVTVCGASIMHPRLVQQRGDREEKRREEEEKRREEEEKGKTKKEPAATSEGQIIEKIFPELPRPDGTADAIREALKGHAWDLSLEAKSCRSWHEERNPARKRRNWTSALVNWAKMYAKRQAEQGDQTEADILAERERRRKEDYATRI